MSDYLEVDVACYDVVCVQLFGFFIRVSARTSQPCCSTRTISSARFRRTFGDSKEC